MNYKSIKLASESPVPVELIKHDTTIKAVVIGDLRIEGDYGLKVLVAQPYEKVKRHKITATIEGFGQKVEYFDYRHDAESRVSELEATGAVVARDDVEVLIDDKGEIHGATTSSDVACENPF